MDDLMAYSYKSKPNFELTYKEDDGRISLAYEHLPAIPRKIADKFALRTHTLDLSHNNIKDLMFLSNFKILHTLILDNNISLNEKTLPFLPSVRILWLNKCGIRQLAKWVHRINICTPNIQQLSLMGNPGIRSTFNGGSSLENNDYMMYVIGNLPYLEVLDDARITDDQREVAIANVSSLAINGTASINFHKHYTSEITNRPTILKHDAKAIRHFGQLVPKRSTYKFDGA
ncbi:leucine-rich melanocyte differentiation-associated protein-like [Contarinia nasturtii]|uniref:leucine-rich melanocyte differentiation-associated protein-like n=1 Tax=Contarinia nasturtii TaxID=265458 RepID=UPI0012D3EBD1|nr:leucine-rich melanocyte differentiation-associated protein-like [Contarinia nasturtii]